MSYEFGYKSSQEFEKALEDTSGSDKMFPCGSAGSTDWAVIWEYQNLGKDASGVL